MIRVWRVILVAALLAGAPARAADPSVTVTVAPEGPVTVGTAVEVTATVLVPSWMPTPPVWPDLEIADAVTRLPERATRPVTRRVGGDTWSGLSRTWQIIPQRAADYDLGGRSVTVTYADPATSQPVKATLAFPDVAIPARIPAGAEGMEPFLAATALSVAAEIEGLPAAPKPGDGFTLTLTTTASGPPSILLPPLGDRLVTPAGLHTYPRQPVLTDGKVAIRSEAIAYVIEAPGSYAIPPVSIEWWNSEASAREMASTEPIGFTVAGGALPAGGLSGRLLAAIGLAGLAVGLGLALVLRRRRAGPSVRALRRAAVRAARAEPPGVIRAALAAWETARGVPVPSEQRAALEGPLRELDRATYGPASAEGPDPAARGRLIAALRAIDRPRPRPAEALPALNPAP